MEIAHEGPLEIFDIIRQLTDYDYAIASICRDNDQYYQKFKNRKPQRKLILDNGAFEDGFPMEKNDYKNWINDLQPDEYVVPDILNDYPETIKKFKEWMESDVSTLPGKPIGVIQGYDFNDIVSCCKDMIGMGCEKIAIPHGLEYYQNLIQDVGRNKYTKYEKQALGRYHMFGNLLDQLSKLELKQYSNIKFHLLGSSVPYEFQLYKGKNKKFVESVDTSNPIIYGIYVGSYPIDWLSVKTKIPTKVKDILDKELEPKQREAIRYNIKEFKEKCA